MTDQMSGDFQMPSYVVYFDTNVAHSEKPAEPISEGMLSEIRRARELAEIEVRVPEVVLEELTYRQNQIALASAENLSKNLLTLQEACGIDDYTVPEPDALEDSVRIQFQGTLDEAGIDVVETPCEKIDWKSVVHQSCWRIPPFEKLKSGDKLAEKGFRDKVILETALIDSADITDSRVVFICDDNLLRGCFEEYAEGKENIEVHKRFSEFLGVVELLHEAKSKDLVTAVLRAVRPFFFDEENMEGVAISCGVFQELENEYLDQMEMPDIWQIRPSQQSRLTKPPSSMTPFAALGSLPRSWIDEANNWSPVSDLKFKVDRPETEKSENDGRFHWRSRITMARLFRRVSPSSRDLVRRTEERLKTKIVDVLWSCEIDLTTAKPSNPSVDEYEPQFGGSFEEADLPTRNQYGLPLVPGFGGDEY